MRKDFIEILKSRGASQSTSGMVLGAEMVNAFVNTETDYPLFNRAKKSVHTGKSSGVSTSLNLDGVSLQALYDSTGKVINNNDSSFVGVSHVVEFRPFDMILPVTWAENTELSQLNNEFLDLFKAALVESILEITVKSRYSALQDNTFNQIKGLSEQGTFVSENGTWKEAIDSALKTFRGNAKGKKAKKEKTIVAIGAQYEFEVIDELTANNAIREDFYHMNGKTYYRGYELAFDPALNDFAIEKAVVVIYDEVLEFMYSELIEFDEVKNRRGVDYVARVYFAPLVRNSELCVVSNVAVTSGGGE